MYQDFLKTAVSSEEAWVPFVIEESVFIELLSKFIEEETGVKLQAHLNTYEDEDNIEIWEVCAAESILEQNYDRLNKRGWTFGGATSEEILDAFFGVMWRARYVGLSRLEFSFKKTDLNQLLKEEMKMPAASTDLKI